MIAIVLTLNTCVINGSKTRASTIKIKFLLILAKDDNI